MQNITFVEQRAEWVLLKAYLASENRTHVHSKQSFNLVAPHDSNLPRGVEVGSPEHVLFLFLVTLVTLQSSSDVGFRQAVRLYEAHPECFGREAIVLASTIVSDTKVQVSLKLGKNPNQGKRKKELPMTKLGLLFKGVGFNKPKPWAVKWGHVVRTLHEEYDGDPLALVRDVKTVDGMLLKKKQKKKEGKTWWMNGYGPKLFSLFCIYMEDQGLVDEVPDAFPADVHVQGIALSTGIVVTQDAVVRDTPLAELLRHSIADFCRDHGLSRSVLAFALWHNGSKLCSKCWKTSDVATKCPIYAMCDGRPPTWGYWNKGVWELLKPWKLKGAPNSGQLVFVF